MERQPIVVPQGQITDLYRFSDSIKEVNWNARYKSDPEFLGRLVPHLYNFLDENIRKVTYFPDQLRAVVGISGGLDSSVATTLVANSMLRAQEAKTANSSSLVMLSFKGMSFEDFQYAKRFARWIEEQYPDLNPQFASIDLSPLLKQVDDQVHYTLLHTKRDQYYSGELTSRIYSTYIMEYANRSAHCAIDPTNGTEVILGEIVIGAGEECAPLADLYKSQVYDLAELVGVPQFVIDRPPLNSTWGHDKVATYFRERPEGLSPRAAYQVLDPILYYLFERKLEPEAVAERLGHSKEFVNKVAQRIKNQDHRRGIPFFVLNNRPKEYVGSIPDIQNEKIEKYLEESLAIAD